MKWKLETHKGLAFLNKLLPSSWNRYVHTKNKWKCSNKKMWEMFTTDVLCEIFKYGRRLVWSNTRSPCDMASRFSNFPPWRHLLTSPYSRCVQVIIVNVFELDVWNTTSEGGKQKVILGKGLILGLTIILTSNSSLNRHLQTISLYIAKMLSKYTPCNFIPEMCVTWA